LMNKKYIITFIYLLTQQPKGQVWIKHEQTYRQKRMKLSRSKARRLDDWTNSEIPIGQPLCGGKKEYTYIYILRRLNAVIWRMNHYEIWLRKTISAPNTLTSGQTTLASKADPGEGQFLLKEQTLNQAESLLVD
jgi:hypothetical protein